MGLVLIAHGVVFIWQAVGVVRSAENHVRGSGQMFSAWGAQLALLLGAFWVLSYSLEAWQLLQPEQNEVPNQATLNADRAARYTLTVEGKTLHLVGSLELGVTARVKKTLAENLAVAEVHLTSNGGNIYEARGLGTVFRERKVTTFVQSECSSACTTAFIGGVKRVMGHDAKLGFHQYRIDADYAVLNADPKREQKRDLEVFRAAGVAEWFLRKMHQSAASSMWYPRASELLDARVVTHVVTP